MTFEPQKSRISFQTDQSIFDSATHMVLLLKPPRVRPSYIVLVWLGLGMATVLMPLTMFIGARATSREWDSGDQANGNYEAAANNAWWNWGGNNNNNNNQWENGDQGNGQEQEEDQAQEDQAQQYQNNNAGGNNAYNYNNNMYQNSKPWWKFWGNNQNVYGQQGGGADGGSRDQGSVPWWYWGGHQGAEGREEELRAPPVLIAAYLWSLLVFFSILFFGFRSFRAKGNMIGLEVALLMFACYCVLSMFVFSSVDGAVVTYGRVVEEHGFLGQLGVMVYITSVLWILFCVGFAIFIRRQVAAKAANQNLQDDILRL